MKMTKPLQFWMLLSFSTFATSMPTAEIDSLFEEKVEHATRNVKSTRRRSLIVKNVANAQKRWQKNFLGKVKSNFQKLENRSAALEDTRIRTDANVYELSKRIDGNAELAHNDVAHLSERSRELNERVRKIEAEQLELEAIMNEAVAKVALAAEADYSAEDDTTEETLNLLNEKYNSLDKRFKDWWEIFATNLKQANENKIAMDNMKNDIRELDKKITELLVKIDL